MALRHLLLPALTILALAACRESEAPEPGPIIVISIDTLRSDHLPAYGYRGVATPAIDALREDSILFERAYSHCPLTLPAHASILTGHLPRETGIHDNAGFRLKAGVETLPETLRKGGYQSGAAVSSFALHQGSGISRGFDFYDDSFVQSAGDRTMTDIQRAGDDTTTVARNWIDAHGSGKFFFLLHLYEPHSPYTPPEPYASTYPSPYDGEIAHADAITGRFLQYLRDKGIYDRATIILLSDHGEGLGDHGEDEHGILLNREVLQVPLLVKLPGGRERGTSRSLPVQLIDVFPTLCELAGVPLPSSEGRSLLSQSTAERSIVSETSYPSLHLGWSDLHSIVQGNLHLIRGTRAELFDLIKDPGERTDVSKDNRRSFATMSSALAPHMVPVKLTEQITSEEAAKLAALGYLGSAAPTTGKELPDPRDHIASYQKVRHAWGAFDRGLYDEAIATSGALLAEYPQMLDLYQLQADAYGHLGRPREGAEAAKRGLTAHPGAEALYIRVADLSFRAGDLTESRRYADLAGRAAPWEAATLLSRISLAERNPEAARGEANRAIKAAPERTQPFVALGEAELAVGNAAAALAAFDRALANAAARRDSTRSIQSQRGVALESLGRPGEAEMAFREEVRQFPEAPAAYRNLILYLLAHGRAPEALPLIRKLLEGNGSAEAYAVVADALAAAGNVPASRQTIRDGLARHPNDPILSRFSR